MCDGCKGRPYNVLASVEASACGAACRDDGRTIVVHKTTAVGRSEIWGESPLLPLLPLMKELAELPKEDAEHRDEFLGRMRDELFTPKSISWIETIPPEHITMERRFQDFLQRQVAQVYGVPVEVMKQEGDRQAIELYGMPVLMDKALPPGAWHIKAKELET